jgi:hypothetical protein
MEPLPVDIHQLQRRDPAAWSALLARAATVPGMPAPVVTAVVAEPLESVNLAISGEPEASRRARRFVLTIDGVSDPVTFVGKRTGVTEALVYQTFGPHLPGILPVCHTLHVAGDRSWIVLDDVPDDFPGCVWTATELDAAAGVLGTTQATATEALEEMGPSAPSWLPHLFQGDAPAALDDLRRRNATLFDDGPGAVISDHAIRSARRLAPALLRAANGLVVMRVLRGRPGVLGESHLAAVADLIDDPVPLLGVLADLPATLLHNAAHPYHWRQTMFGEQYLIDWSHAGLGPGIVDLATLLESYPLALRQEGRWSARELSAADEEAALDAYLLAQATELGPRFPARAVRAALPAARCLNVLTQWFPYFASWASDMPDKYVWQRVNRMDEATPGDLATPETAMSAHGLGELQTLKPYLAGVFQRFLAAYRNL